MMVPLDSYYEINDHTIYHVLATAHHMFLLDTDW